MSLREVIGFLLIAGACTFALWLGFDQDAKKSAERAESGCEDSRVCTRTIEHKGEPLDCVVTDERNWSGDLRYSCNWDKYNKQIAAKK